MNEVAKIVRTVEVDADPATAFEAFTQEIGVWFKSTPHSWNDPKRAVGIRFEPGVGGRLIEVYDQATGEGYDVGRIVVWEPGRRLVFAYRSVVLPAEPLTEVEVRFEPIASGTQVTLEHRGFERLPADIGPRFAGRGWLYFMQWFRDYVAARQGQKKL